MAFSKTPKLRIPMGNPVKGRTFKLPRKPVVVGSGARGRQHESHPRVVEVTFRETDEPDEVSERSGT